MTQEERDKGAVSLCIIKEANLSFFAAICLFAHEYAEERGAKGVVCNGDGGYEFIMLPNENIEQPQQPGV